jgi:hypothetical protein
MDLAQGQSGALPPPNKYGNFPVMTLARLIAEGRLSPDIGVSCRGKNDGAGAQAGRIISAMLAARFAGCRYRHSPFVSMGHSESTREDWARRWERFLNFGDGETLLPEDAETVPLSAVIARPAAYAGRPVVIVERVFHLPPDIHTETRKGLQRDLRAKYWRSPKAEIPSHRAASGFTIAVHLRRGDVTGTSNAHRYVRNEVMLRHIARLRRAMAPFGRPLTINLYSEGIVADFQAFADAGCNLHISEDAFETFHNMVTADILMIAHSSFSHLAGILSQGIVLDHRVRAVQFPGWLHRRGSGEIAINRLRRAILDRTSWRERQFYRARRWWRLVSRVGR